MKNFLIGLLILVVLVFGGLAIKIVFFPVQKIANSVDTAYGVADKTLNAENAMNSYKYFLEQEEAIKAKYLDEQVALKAIDTYKSNLNSDKNKWSDSDKNELSRLQTVADAISYQTNAMIADYNAKSKDITMNIWKDNLPSTMSRAFLANQQFSK